MKFNPTTIRTFAAATLTLGLTFGCSAENQTTASIDDIQTSAPAPLAVNVPGQGGHALGAGDALGMAMFEETDSTTRLALFRTANEAFAVAEAKEASGEYDAWYAAATGQSLEQPDGTAIAEADTDSKSEQADDEQSPEDVFVTVPVTE